MSNEVSRQVSIEKNYYHKLMINATTCSILESPSTYDYDEMYNGVYKSTVLEPTIKRLVKETSHGRRAARNLVSRVQNIGA